MGLPNGTDASSVQVPISRNTFLGWLLSAVVTVAGAGYTYVAALKTSVEAEARDIAVLKSQVEGHSHQLDTMDRKLDRLLTRGSSAEK